MYIEYVLIINFFIDYILLLTVSLILNINVKNKRLIFSSLVGEISLLYLFINSAFLLFIFKAILGLLIIYLAFGYKNKKSFLNAFIWFYILSFFLGGVLYYIKDNLNINYYIILLFIPIIMNIYKYFTYNLKTELNLKYKVNIYLNNGRILYLNGYMDSANTLIDPISNKKVIIINEYVNENFYLVPYETIGSTHLIRCFKPKKVYIDSIGERKDIVVGIINKKFNGYDCLLNYGLMEGL